MGVEIVPLASSTDGGRVTTLQMVEVERPYLGDPLSNYSCPCCGFKLVGDATGLRDSRSLGLS